MERELLLLGLLRQQEMHGYQLIEFINRDLSYCTDLKKPTAYFVLNKMVDAGWIHVETVEQSRRPDRRVYHITEAGETNFQRLLRENLATHSTTRFTDDIGIAFLDALPAAEAVTLLTQRRDAVAALLARAETVPEHHGSLNLVIEHQVRHLRAEVEWLNEVIARLRAATDHD